MLTLSYMPRAPLNPFVERLWLVSQGQCVRTECILPSGTVELVVNLCDVKIVAIPSYRSRSTASLAQASVARSRMCRGGSV